MRRLSAGTWLKSSAGREMMAGTPPAVGVGDVYKVHVGTDIRTSTSELFHSSISQIRFSGTLNRTSGQYLYTSHYIPSSIVQCSPPPKHYIIKALTSSTTIVTSVNSTVRLDCCANCVATSSNDSTILGDQYTYRTVSFKLYIVI